MPHSGLAWSESQLKKGFSLENYKKQYITKKLIQLKTQEKIPEDLSLGRRPAGQTRPKTFDLSRAPSQVPPEGEGRCYFKSIEGIQCEGKEIRKKRFQGCST